jgi:hypothetical protein
VGGERREVESQTPNARAAEPLASVAYLLSASGDSRGLQWTRKKVENGGESPCSAERRAPPSHEALAVRLCAGRIDSTAIGTTILPLQGATMRALRSLGRLVLIALAALGTAVSSSADPPGDYREPPAIFGRVQGATVPEWQDLRPETQLVFRFLQHAAPQFLAGHHGLSAGGWHVDAVYFLNDSSLVATLSDTTTTEYLLLTDDGIGWRFARPRPVESGEAGYLWNHMDCDSTYYFQVTHGRARGIPMARGTVEVEIDEDGQPKSFGVKRPCASAVLDSLAVERARIVVRELAAGGQLKEVGSPELGRRPFRVAVPFMIWSDDLARYLLCGRETGRPDPDMGPLRSVPTEVLPGRGQR